MKIRIEEALLMLAVSLFILGIGLVLASIILSL